MGREGVAAGLLAALKQELRELREGQSAAASDAVEWKAWFGLEGPLLSGRPLLVARALLAAFMDSVWLGFIVGYSR